MDFVNKINKVADLKIPIENINLVKRSFNWDNSAQQYYQIFLKIMEN